MRMNLGRNIWGCGLPSTLVAPNLALNNRGFESPSTLSAPSPVSVRSCELQ